MAFDFKARAKAREEQEQRRRDVERDRNMRRMERIAVLEMAFIAYAHNELLRPDVTAERERDKVTFRRDWRTIEVTAEDGDTYSYSDTGRQPGFTRVGLGHSDVGVGEDGLMDVLSDWAR